MKKEFEKPLLEAKESVEKIKILLDMLTPINMRKLNFMFNEHIENYSLPVNTFDIQDLRYEFGKLGYRHGDDDPDSSAYTNVIEYLYQLVYVIAVHNKEMPTLKDNKAKVPSKQNALTDYERGVLDPELDEYGNFQIKIVMDKGGEDYLTFTSDGEFTYETGVRSRQCLSYKNTYRMYLSMKRFFENKTDEDANYE